MRKAAPGMGDSCPGIALRDSGRTLALKFAKRNPVIPQTLASLDFAVIPRGSINPSTLAITDYRNTSGPYYVEKDGPGGNLLLKVNPRHFHYSSSIPQEAAFVPYPPSDPLAPLAMFAAGKVDLISTLDKIPCDTMIDFARGHRREANLHRTYPIKLFIATFTHKSLGRQRPRQGRLGHLPFRLRAAGQEGDRPDAGRGTGAFGAGHPGDQPLRGPGSP